MEVLRYSATLGAEDIVALVDDRLRASELEAARSAEPTAGAGELIHAAVRAGREVAIVSNNSASAIATYLEAHGLAAHVACVAGRAYADPSQMKPNPAPVYRALSTLGVAPASCVLVGDSTADVLAARASGVRIIGYANKPGKRTRLLNVGAKAIINDIAVLAALVEHSSAFRAPNRSSPAGGDRRHTGQATEDEVGSDG